jgi:catalase
MSEPSASPGRWGTARPGRRDVLRGLAAVGAFLAADLAALLTANDWFGPSRLTPQVFLDEFAKVFGRQPGFRKNHAKGVAVAGWFDSNGNGNGTALSKAAVFAPGRTPVLG